MREADLKLADGETAEIVGGVVLITSVGCNNGCNADDVEDKPKTRKKRESAAADGELCGTCEGEKRPAGHTGRHTKAKAEA